VSRTACVCSEPVQAIALSACASTGEVKMKMTTRSVDPGTSATLQGKSFNLLGEPLKEGKALPLSVVFSTDTPVREEQTHKKEKRDADPSSASLQIRSKLVRCYFLNMLSRNFPSSTHDSLSACAL
jgi:hypothetical protein